MIFAIFASILSCRSSMRLMTCMQDSTDVLWLWFEFRTSNRKLDRSCFISGMLTVKQTEDCWVEQIQESIRTGCMRPKDIANTNDVYGKVFRETFLVFFVGNKLEQEGKT